ILYLLYPDLISKCSECSQLPSVERAFVPDEYKKVQYQTGDVIYFSCDPGYTTGFNTTYICTEQGWGATTYGQCKGTFSLLLGCTRPPALTNGHALKNSSYFYVDGTKVAYRCDNPYTMTGGSYKTCSNGQWTGDLHCHSKSTLDLNQGKTDVVDYQPKLWGEKLNKIKTLWVFYILLYSGQIFRDAKITKQRE
uniref:Sushi domain-containing protein n=1 Tax=Neogobius melanostomus TaxID=47308 RepID=A0A8C6UQA9_9GOBI